MLTFDQGVVDDDLNKSKHAEVSRAGASLLHFRPETVSVP